MLMVQHSPAELVVSLAGKLKFNKTVMGKNLYNGHSKPPVLHNP